MLQRLLGRGRAHLLDGGGAEGPAAGGEQDRGDLAVLAGQQRLEDRAVLGVGGDDVDALLVRQIEQRPPGADHRLLVGQGQPVAGVDRGHYRRQPGRSGNRRQHHVHGLAGDGGRGIVARDDFTPAVWRILAELGRRRIVGEGHGRAAEFGADLHGGLPVGVDRDVLQLEQVAMQPQERQGAGADRARGSQYGDRSQATIP